MNLLIQSNYLPWGVESNESTGFWHVLKDSNGNEVGSGDGGYEEEDARRIVACVNACEGIPTETLEHAAIFPPAKSSLNGYLDMKKQRDELLAALKARRSFICELVSAGGKYPFINGTVLVHDAYDEIKAIDDAIEKAEKQLAHNADLV